MTPGEDVTQKVAKGSTRGLQGVCEDAVSEELLEAWKYHIKPLLAIQGNGFQVARQGIFNQAVANVPGKKGVDLMLQTAEDNVSLGGPHTTDPGRIAWVIGDDEIMTFESNGDILVKGRLVENDLEVVKAFREWFARAQ